MQRFFAIGNTTREPEFTTTPNGVAVCKFSIAVNRRFRNDEVDYFPITTFKNTAENCHKFLAKGNKVAVIGSIQINSYNDREGIKRTSVDVIADEVQFLTPKSDIKPQPAYQTKMTPVDDESEQLPF